MQTLESSATTENATFSPVSKAPGRIDGIDLLRGLSILAVILHHIHLRIRLEKTPMGDYLPRQIISFLGWNGANGVFIFFAISGFLITTTCLRRWRSLDNISLPAFYRFRSARIAPCLLALLTVLCVLHLAGAKYFVITHSTLPRAIAAALTFHVNWLESTHGYLPGNWDVLWSLSNEEMFYLFFPVLCILLKRVKFIVPALLVFVLLGPFARTVLSQNELWRDYGYLSSMDAIALGCISALFGNRVQLASATLRLMQILGSLMMIFVTLFKRDVSFLGLYAYGLDITILALGVCLLMISFTQRNSVGSKWTAPLRWYGRNSYEVYLTHMFVVFGLLRVFETAGSPYQWSLFWYAGIVILTGLFGEIVARYFSEPLNRKLRGSRKRALVAAATSAAGTR